jgi:predicted GNAT family N-acyltransferase
MLPTRFRLCVNQGLTVPVAGACGGRENGRMGRTPEIAQIIVEAGDLPAARAIRRIVFIAEQGVSETEEMDTLDGACRHYVARIEGAAVGTARLRPYGDGTAKIERMAVLAAHRNSGVGRALLTQIEADSAANGTTEIVLHAQDHALGFYGRCGYIVDGDGFAEAGIPHHKMKKTLTSS